jgi:hypothetical protein
LQDDLDLWVKSYNEERPHQGRWCFGKTPLQTFLDAIPIAGQKMIAAGPPSAMNGPPRKGHCLQDQVQVTTSSVYLRNATTAASSSFVRTVERTSFGPHRGIVGKAPLLPLGDSLRVDPVVFSQLVQALLTMLYCSMHCRRRAGASMVSFVP